MIRSDAAINDINDISQEKGSHIGKERGDAECLQIKQYSQKLNFIVYGIMYMKASWHLSLQIV